MRLPQEPSLIPAVANIFDKHVFHWLRMTWDQFEQTKVRSAQCFFCPHYSSFVDATLLLSTQRLFCRRNAAFVDATLRSSLPAKRRRQRSVFDEYSHFGDAQSVYGMVLVSGLVKEMFTFLETVVVKGGHADRFACEVRWYHHETCRCTLNPKP